MNAVEQVGNIEIGAGIFPARADGFRDRRDKRSGVRLIEAEPRSYVAAERRYCEEPEHKPEMVFGNNGAAGELETGIFINPAAFELCTLAEEMLSARPCALAKRNGFLAYAEEKLRVGLRELKVASRRAGCDFVEPVSGSLGEAASGFQYRFGCVGQLGGGAKRFGLQEEKRQGVKGRLKRGKGVFCRHRGLLWKRNRGTQKESESKAC